MRRVERRVRDVIAELTEPSTVTITQIATGSTDVVPAMVSLGLSTTVSSGALIAATTTLQDEVNSNRKLINKLIDILREEGLVST